jgi:hypothetical protein
LEEASRFDLAAGLYARVLKMQPGSLPTKRQLALSNIAAGQTDAGIDMLVGLYKETGQENESWSQIIRSDILEVLQANGLSASTYGLDIEELKEGGHDLRVILDWNREEVGLDMQLIDPDLEIASSMTPSTNSGGRILGSTGAANGPLTYLHKGYLPGSYYLKVVYTNRETMENPDGLYVKLTVYRDFGKGSPQKEVKVIRLEGKAKLELIDRIAIL